MKSFGASHPRITDDAPISMRTEKKLSNAMSLAFTKLHLGILGKGCGPTADDMNRDVDGLQKKRQLTIERPCKDSQDRHVG